MTNRRAATKQRLTVILDRVATLQAAVADLKSLMTSEIDEQADELLGEIAATLHLDWRYCLPCGESLGDGQCIDCSDCRHEREEMRDEKRHYPYGRHGEVCP
jgi:hypothetical protein